MSDSNSINTEIDGEVEINEELANGEEVSTTQTDVQPDTDDLDAFNDLLTGKKTKAPVEEEPSDASPQEETSEESVEPLATEEPAPKPKSRFQERIDELTAKAREAERKEQDLQAKLDEVLAKLNEKKTPETTGTNQPEAKTKEGPQPDEVLESGEAKYPLGEFDPAYVRDLTRYELQQAMREKAAEEAEQAKQREVQQAQEALQNEWQERVSKSLDRYPDLPEKEEALATAFENVDPNYGTYLASVIMSMDYGPDVLYHLSTNLEEAKKIVESGPARATIALGRLEARYALQEEEKNKQHKLKVSKAPTPPERLNKGSMVSKDIPDDTDDLDAFAAKLFSSPRRR